ncbi:hypothetical protein DFH11DRAFT_1731836 [Phellopilus nigrolimitatus]|nr:hypothetical protein DFH11DRAFT_1731836 [Phellopilus nigrolimitatus]
MRLVDLPADVLLKILGLCDVEDVLRTCRVLRDVAATRHLWVSHLRGLPNECPPDLPPHVSLESLDCADLKTLVGRASSYDKPIQEPAFVRKASLVPGGDYLVVHWENDSVQLLEVRKGEKIWLYPDPYFSDLPVQRL